MVSSDSNSLPAADSSARVDSTGAGETLGKDEAARFLGVSSRALERYTASGRVAVGYAPGKTRSVAVYERAELEKLKAELQRPLLRGATSAGTAESKPVDAGNQNATTPTRTATGAVQIENSAFAQSGDRDREIEPETSTNPDNPLLPASDELAALSASFPGGAQNALDALTQLVLERLIERLHGEAGGAVTAGLAPAPSGLALVLAAPAPKGVSATPGEKLLLTLPEAASLTGLSRAYLKNAIAKGTLVAKPIGRLWRIKRADLDAFIDAL